MLDKAVVLERAIRWRAIAMVAVLNKESGAGDTAFANGSAYIDVLNVPWNKQEGVLTRESIQLYADGLATKFILESGNNLMQFLDDNVKLEVLEIVTQ